jgi:hypothetical protein
LILKQYGGGVDWIDHAHDRDMWQAVGDYGDDPLDSIQCVFID